MKVVYHADTVEVWFSPTNKRFYTVWSQFLADAESIFGDRLHDQSKSDGPARAGFGRRAYDGAHPAANGVADEAWAPLDLAPLAPGQANELESLKREMKILERAIKVVGMQRDEWKKEADMLRGELENSRSEMMSALQANANLSLGGGGSIDRYKQVRQVIVRRLHPDVPGTPDEKSYREKLFKTIWQEIEVLDKKG